jgi:hypothetical protein
VSPLGVERVTGASPSQWHLGELVRADVFGPTVARLPRAVDRLTPVVSHNTRGAAQALASPSSTEAPSDMVWFPVGSSKKAKPKPLARGQGLLSGRDQPFLRNSNSERETGAEAGPVV